MYIGTWNDLECENLLPLALPNDRLAYRVDEDTDDLPDLNDDKSSTDCGSTFSDDADTPSPCSTEPLFVIEMRRLSVDPGP